MAFLVALGIGLGLVVWKAWQDPDIAWLSRDDRAAWIRYPSPAATKASAIVRMTTEYRKTFTIDHPPNTAVLRVRFFRKGLVRLNGREVDLRHCGTAWKSSCRAEVALLLRPGANDIEVSVDNDSALPALWLEIDGPGLVVASDTSWDSSLAGGSWRKAVHASDPPGAPRTDPFDTAPSPFRSLLQRWAAIVGFALLSSAVLAIALASSRRRGTVGSTSGTPWPWRIAVMAVALGWIALFASNWANLPIDWGFDAPAHLEYVSYILDRHALPMPDEGWSMFHPPLYYAVLAGVLGLAGSSPSAQDAAAWIRILGLAIGLLNVLAVGALVRRAGPNDPTRQVVGVLTAGFLPVMLYLHQFPTNEILVAMLSSVALLMAHDILEERTWATRRLALLGAVLGLALLTKLSALLSSLPCSVRSSSVR